MTCILHVLQRAAKPTSHVTQLPAFGFKTNEEIRVLPMKTLQSQNIFLFRYQKVNQNQQFAFIA